MYMQWYTALNPSIDVHARAVLLAANLAFRLDVLEVLGKSGVASDLLDSCSEFRSRSCRMRVN